MSATDHGGYDPSAAVLIEVRGGKWSTSTENQPLVGLTQTEVAIHLGTGRLERLRVAWVFRRLCGGLFVTLECSENYFLG
jgi:hypothetical protein